MLEMYFLPRLIKPCKDIIETAVRMCYYLITICIDYIRRFGASRCFLNNCCKDSFAEVC